MERNEGRRLFELCVRHGAVPGNVYQWLKSVLSTECDERVEVVVYAIKSKPRFYTSDPVADNLKPEAVEPLMTVAQHEALRAADRAEIDLKTETMNAWQRAAERKTEALARATAERDAALAKLAELENQEPVNLSDDVREYLQEGINSATQCEDADMDYDFANQLGALLDPLYAQPRPAAVVMPARVAVRDAIAQALGDAYDCVRVWDAWAVGTMGPDDFVQVVEQEDRLHEIVDAVFARLNAAAQVPEAGGLVIPEGWQLVPKFLTGKMADAIRRGVEDARFESWPANCWEWALEVAPQPAAQQVPEGVRRETVALAYGFLWHVNNEPGTPAPLYSPAAAASKARILLRDMLTSEERGKAIHAAGQAIGRYPVDALSAQSNEKEGE